MKMRVEHQEKLEKLMEEQAVKRGATNIRDWIKKTNSAIDLGLLPGKFKDKRIFILSYLQSGDALRFIVDEIYEYCDMNHLHTFTIKLYKKHTS